MRELPTPVSVEEALQGASYDIFVEEGTAVTVGPFEERYAEGFRLAEVFRFEDLQQLGYIHRQLTEESVLGAMRADDRLFREVQRQQGHGRSEPCSCDPSDERPALALTRLRLQDHLIDLLQPLYRQSLDADDPAVLHTFHHARAWLSRPSRYLIGLIALNDINIADNATLNMTPAVQALYANDINIGGNGRLRFASGGVHVRCRTLNGPARPIMAGITDIDRYVHGLARERREVQA